MSGTLNGYHEPRGWIKYALAIAGSMIFVGSTMWLANVDSDISALEKEIGVEKAETRERLMRVETRIESIDDKLERLDRGQQSIENKLDSQQESLADKLNWLIQKNNLERLIDPKKE